MALQLIIMAVFGALCALLANNKGRSAVGWFILGFLFPLLGLILVLVLPDLKKQQVREARLRDENRRLRERMLKDRQVADQRYDQINRRVGAHDRVLGVDTGGADPAPQLADRQQPEGRSRPVRTSRRRPAQPERRKFLDE